MIANRALFGVLILFFALSQARKRSEYHSKYAKQAASYDPDRIDRITQDDPTYAHELDHLSMYMEDHVIEGSIYKTYGTAVFMYDTVKILPQTWGTKGAVFMRKPIVTDAFTTVMKMNLKSLPTSPEKRRVSGFAIWYL